MSNLVRVDELPAADRFDTPRLIRCADPDMLKLLMPVRGTGSYVVTQDGRQARLRPGEFALYDLRRPYEADCGVGEVDASQALTFMFPFSLLPLPPSQLKQLTAVRIPRRRVLAPARDAPTCPADPHPGLHPAAPR